MKSVIEGVESKEEELKFPVLMQCTDEGCGALIVMFDCLTCGTVIICDTGEFSVGSYHEDWASCRKDRWKKFTGKITLSND